jgi:hypothetical protein
MPLRPLLLLKRPNPRPAATQRTAPGPAVTPFVTTTLGLRYVAEQLMFPH